MPTFHFCPCELPTCWNCQTLNTPCACHVMGCRITRTVHVCNGHKMLAFPPLAVPAAFVPWCIFLPLAMPTCCACAMVHLPALGPHLLCLPHFPTHDCACLHLPLFPACAHLPLCTCLTLALVSVQLLVAMHLNSSCTQRSPQLWAFSDTGAVNSIKGDSEDCRSTPTCLNCGL